MKFNKDCLIDWIDNKKKIEKLKVEIERIRNNEPMKNGEGVMFWYNEYKELEKTLGDVRDKAYLAGLKEADFKKGYQQGYRDGFSDKETAEWLAE